MQSRFPGTVPTPYEIPPELLPEEKKEKLPLPITLYAVYRFIWAGISFLLALLPWGNPKLGLASYLLARPALLVFLLPGFLQMLVPSTHEISSWSPDAFIQGAPFLFLLAALLYGAMGWYLLTQSRWWRGCAVFVSGWTVAQITLGLLFRLVYQIKWGEALPPVPRAKQLALLVVWSWNLVVYCYLAYDPGVRKAFEKRI
jgi:hypothetical protein